MKFFLWLLRAVIFFALLAFALNNQQDVTVHFFFGTQWSAALVLIVLAAFTLGVAVGVLGMVQYGWRKRRKQRSSVPAPASEPSAPPPTVDLPASIHGI
ncbi:hypothetical protein GCM10022279_21340 [Comamonas faecalis]|uniref:Lipopolysaccharide assembly protein A domain-containing protein n=1 Tax=Comamonas faecalis TaxID=1387849 RepID=A0ABP7RGY9_9BURK